MSGEWILRIVAILLFAIIAGSPFISKAGTSLPEWAVSGSPGTHHSAGCYIPTEFGVVVAINQHGTIQLPFGKPKIAGETPEQTAIRETLEETGLTVHVHEIVAEFSDGPQFVENDHSNRQLLYRCTVEGWLPYQRTEPLDANEVAQVIVLNPVTMQSYNNGKITAPWRFESDREMLIRLWESR